jgi:LysM repeat protein
MDRPHKRYASLDFPLFPQRRRPWLRLALTGAALGLVIFAGWGRLLRAALPARLPSPAARPGQVVLVRSAVITPTVSLPAFTAPAGVEFIDEVQEVELAWSEREGRAEILTYSVQDGDTLWSIANQFALDIDTLRWSNRDLERNPDLLAVGMELLILPVPGVYHVVQTGDTLSDIAQRYGVAEVDILNYPLNELESPDDLQAGQKLVIPHGLKWLARPTPQPSLESAFAWPLVGSITQGYSEKHRGIDIGAPYGSGVYAGRAGQVIRSGWARTGYGYTVVISHDQGLLSLYSHMKGEWVQAGDWVERGQLIGEVGSTGHSSGPHVHFEVRVDGDMANPLDYLTRDGPR